MNMLIPIVTYHYVRPPSERFSEIHKSLDFDRFSAQIEYLSRDYFFIQGTQVRNLNDDLDSNGKMPVWLSFDDGYSDHYKYVFPELLSRGAVGSFFIPTEAIFERKLLDVNKIHLVLAQSANIGHLIVQINEIFDANSGDAILQRSFSELRSEHSIATLINDSETRFVKLLLQELLPLNLRKKVLDNLFKEHVKRNESAIVDELYMDPDQIKAMHEAGMNIGSHGHAHSRLEFMSAESQMIDFKLSLQHLTSVGIDDANLIDWYPYGSSNNETKAVLSAIGCRAAISSKLGIADTSDQDFDWLDLRRIDTKFFSRYFP